MSPVERFSHIDSRSLAVNFRVMELDDNLPVRRSDPLRQLAQQDLDPLSVDELHMRITALEEEITRTRAKIAFTREYRASADALFKR